MQVAHFPVRYVKPGPATSPVPSPPLVPSVSPNHVPSMNGTLKTALIHPECAQGTDRTSWGESAFMGKNCGTGMQLTPTLATQRSISRCSRGVRCGHGGSTFREVLVTASSGAVVRSCVIHGGKLWDSKCLAIKARLNSVFFISESKVVLAE